MRWYRWIAPLLLLMLAGGVHGAGLFPPLDPAMNFALRQPAFSTSTCGECAEGGGECSALCNGTCPNGKGLPEPLRLLETGVTASGVTQVNTTSDGSPVFQFDGSNESYVNISEDLRFQPSQGFTFTVWLSQDPGNSGYVFAKSTPVGFTTFYALRLNSTTETAYFEYRHDGLDEGFRSLALEGVSLANGSLHHIAVLVFGGDFALYVDGRLHSGWHRLVAAVQDGLGVAFLGRKLQDPARFSGLMHSAFFFNSTITDFEISQLADIPPDIHIQPECRCPPSHPVALEFDCEDSTGTSQVPRVNSASHDVSFINDGNSSTSWQSENGEAPVNITISLGGLRTALVVTMQFTSFLPRAMVLYFSTDGVIFQPRQYYALDCSIFGLPNNGSLLSPTDVNCVTAYSTPVLNEVVEFQVLDVGNRPGADSIESLNLNMELQEFAHATHIRLQLVDWNSNDTNDQFFAVTNVSVYGQGCVCNGHADSCMGSECVCEHNTTGSHCELCLPLYNNQTWMSGTGLEGEEGCLQCHEECEGCTGPTPTDCLICRNVLDVDEVTCVTKCPVETYPNASSACQPCNNSCLAFTQDTYSISIPEDRELDTMIIALAVTDRRQFDRPIHFNITNGNTDRLFTINSSSGVITLASSLDHENQPSHQLLIQAVDAGADPVSSESASTTVTVLVDNINDNPPNITGLPTEVVFTEGEGSLLLAPAIVISDADSLPICQVRIILTGQPSDQICVSSSLLGSQSSGQLLEFQGSFTPEEATSLLRSLSFANSEDEPDPLPRSVDIEVSDGNFTTRANIDIILQLTNDHAPVLDLDSTSPGSGYSTTFMEKGPPVAITGPEVSITDPDSGAEGIVSLTIRLLNAQNGTFERLLISAPSELEVQYGDDNHSITVIAPDSGVVPFDSFAAALLTLMYVNDANELRPPLQRFVWIMAFDGTLRSLPVLSVVTIITPIEVSPSKTLVLSVPATDTVVVTPTPFPTPMQSPFFSSGESTLLSFLSTFQLQPILTPTTADLVSSAPISTEKVAPTPLPIPSHSELLAVSSEEEIFASSIFLLQPSLFVSSRGFSTSVQEQSSSVPLSGQLATSTLLPSRVISISHSQPLISSLLFTEMLSTLTIPTPSPIQPSRPVLASSAAKSAAITTSAPTTTLPSATESDTIATATVFSSTGFTFIEPFVTPSPSEDTTTIETSNVFSSVLIPTTVVPTPTDLLLPLSSEPSGPIASVISTVPFSFTPLPSLLFQPSPHTTSLLQLPTSTEKLQAITLATTVSLAESPVFSVSTHPSLGLSPSLSDTASDITVQPSPTLTLTAIQPSSTTSRITISTTTTESGVSSSLFVLTAASQMSPEVRLASAQLTTSVLPLPTFVPTSTMQLEISSSEILLLPSTMAANFATASTTTTIVETSLTLTQSVLETTSLFQTPSFLPTLFSTPQTSVPLSQPAITPSKSLSPLTPSPSTPTSIPLPFSPSPSPSLSEAFTTDLLPLTVTEVLRPETSTHLPINDTVTLETLTSFLPVITSQQPLTVRTSTFHLSTSTSILLPQPLPSTDILLPLSETPQPASSVLPLSSLFRLSISSSLLPMQPVTTITFPRSTATPIPSVPSFPTIGSSTFQTETTILPSLTLTTISQTTSTSTPPPSLSLSFFLPETTVIAIESSMLLPLSAETSTAVTILSTSLVMGISPSDMLATTSSIMSDIETSVLFILPITSSLPSPLTPTQLPSPSLPSQTGQSTTFQVASLPFVSTSVQLVFSSPTVIASSSTVVQETSSIEQPLMPFASTSVQLVFSSPTVIASSSTVIQETSSIEQPLMPFASTSIQLVFSSPTIVASSAVVQETSSIEQPLMPFASTSVQLVFSSPTVVASSSTVFQETSSIEQPMPFASTSVQLVFNSPTVVASSSTVVQETSSIEQPLMPFASTSVQLVFSSPTVIASSTVVQETSSIEQPLMPFVSTSVQLVFSSPTVVASSSTVVQETSSIEQPMPFASTSVQLVFSFPTVIAASSAVVQETSSIEQPLMPFASTSVQLVFSSPTVVASSSTVVQETSSIEQPLMPFASTSAQLGFSSPIAVASSAITQETSSIQQSLMPFASTSAQIGFSSPTVVASSAVVQETSSVEQPLMSFVSTSVHLVFTSPVLSSTVIPFSSTVQETSSATTTTPSSTVTLSSTIETILVQPTFSSAALTPVESLVFTSVSSAIFSTSSLPMPPSLSSTAAVTSSLTLPSVTSSFTDRIVTVSVQSSNPTVATSTPRTSSLPLPLTSSASFSTSTSATVVSTTSTVLTVPSTDAPFLSTVGGVVAVAGGTILIVVLLVVMTILILTFCWYSKKRPIGVSPGETRVSEEEEEKHFEFVVPSTHSISVQYSYHSSSERPDSPVDHVPAALFERVAHYDTPQPSPSIRFRASVAPCLPASNEHEPQKTEYVEQILQSGPEELPADSHVVEEGVTGVTGVSITGESVKGEGVEGEGVEVKRARKDALRLQEEREELEIRARKKATLERLLQQSHNTELRSHRNSRRRLNRTLRELSSSNFKMGRNMRARPYTFPHLSTTGRLPRGIARDVQQELAWMDTGSGVQLIRIQPVEPILTTPPPLLYSYPSHPSHPPIIMVQPRPPTMGSAWERPAPRYTYPFTPTLRQEPQLVWTPDTSPSRSIPPHTGPSSREDQVNPFHIPQYSMPPHFHVRARTRRHDTFL